VGMVACIVAILGCARVSVEAPKEPIKMDISMRLDIYQHIEKDIDAIENIVSGSKAAPKDAGKQSFLSGFLSCAYAQGALAPEVEQAAVRRRDRLQELSSLEAQGIVGEGQTGLAEVRDAARGAGRTAELVRAENEDRMVIYRSVAQNNSTSVEEVQKIYAQKLQAAAPSGTPIEAFVASSGTYQWQKK